MRAAQRFDLSRPSPTDRIVWSDLWRFDRSYWYMVGLCVTFYSVILPFRSTFAIKYFQHAHGLTLQQAGSINAYVFLAAIFATPAFGWMVDASATARLHDARLVSPLRGVSDSRVHESEPVDHDGDDRHRVSLVPAVLWPAVPYVVPPTLGTAYGLMTMLQNIGLMVVNLLAGLERRERRRP